MESFVNFYYLVTTPTLAESSLPYINTALRAFWKHRKVFREFSDSDFGFIKMHSIIKYAHSICENGTAAYYSTKHSEHRHQIDNQTGYRQSNKLNHQSNVLLISTPPQS